MYGTVPDDTVKGRTFYGRDRSSYHSVRTLELKVYQSTIDIERETLGGLVASPIYSRFSVPSTSSLAHCSANAPRPTNYETPTQVGSRRCRNFCVYVGQGPTTTSLLPSSPGRSL